MFHPNSFSYQCVLLRLFVCIVIKWIASPTGMSMTPNRIATCAAVLLISVSTLRFQIHRVTMMSPITKCVHARTAPSSVPRTSASPDTTPLGFHRQSYRSTHRDSLQEHEIGNQRSKNKPRSVHPFLGSFSMWLKKHEHPEWANPHGCSKEGDQKHCLNHQITLLYAFSISPIEFSFG